MNGILHPFFGNHKKSYLSSSFLFMDYQKNHLKIINQIFEIEKKLLTLSAESTHRNFERIKSYWLELGYQIHNPYGEPYNETRTDVEASIAGSSTENLYIEEVIKPIVIFIENGTSRIIQKGVVITKSR
jgi:hypothetical protein